MAQISARHGARRRDPREEAEEARAEASRLRVQVRELQDAAAAARQQLRQQSDEAEYKQLQVEMGKLLVKRTQLQAVHLEREKEELRRSLDAAQAKLLDVEHSFGGLANGLVPRAGRAELKPRPLPSSTKLHGRTSPERPGPERKASSGAFSDGDTNNGSTSNVPRAASSPCGDGANSSHAYGTESDKGQDFAAPREDSTAPAGAKAARASAQATAHGARPDTSAVSAVAMGAPEMSAFSLFVSLSRREERELRHQSSRRERLARAWDRPRLAGEHGEQPPQLPQFRPVEPALKPTRVLSLGALRKRLQGEAEALRHSWGAPDGMGQDSQRDWASDTASATDELTSQLLLSRPSNRRALFKLMAASELIPTEANPGGGTVPIPSWPPLQRLMEPYLESQSYLAPQRQPPRTAERAVRRPASRSSAVSELTGGLPFDIQRPRTQGALRRPTTSAPNVAPMPRTRWTLPQRPPGPILFAAEEGSDGFGAARGVRGGKVLRKASSARLVRAPHSGRYEVEAQDSLFELAPVPPDEINY